MAILSSYISLEYSTIMLLKTRDGYRVEPGMTASGAMIAYINSRVETIGLTELSYRA
jgi:hypothetical protein